MFQNVQILTIKIDLEKEKPETNTLDENGNKCLGFDSLKYSSIKFLGYVVFGYLFVVHLTSAWVVRVTKCDIYNF